MIKRDFQYEKAETYSQDQVDKLLTQHNEFVSNAYKNTVDKVELEKAQEALAEATKKIAYTKTINAAKQLVSQEKVEALIKLTTFEKDKDIVEQLKETLNKNSFLAGEQNIPTRKSAPKIVETQSTTPKQYKYL